MVVSVDDASTTGLGEAPLPSAAVADIIANTWRREDPWQRRFIVVLRSLRTHPNLPDRPRVAYRVETRTLLCGNALGQGTGEILQRYVFGQQRRCLSL